MHAYHIRAARSDELEQLQAIGMAAWHPFEGTGLLGDDPGDPYAIELLQDAVGAGRLWVATGADDVPVGFAHGDDLDGEAYLAEVDVHPDHGRRGLGRRLVERVCDWARAAGYPSLALTTFRDVPWNAPFYARLGFRVLKEGEITPPLQRQREHETSIFGLDPDLRVVMRRML